MSMISVSIFLFPPLTFLPLRSLSTVSKFLLFVGLFLHSSPTLTVSPYAVLHRNFSLPHIFPPPLSGHLLSLPVFIFHSLHMTNLLLTNVYFAPTSTLSSSILLISALLTPKILLTRLFSQTWTPPVVSLLVPTSLVHSRMPG